MEDCISKIIASDTKRVPIGAARLIALRRSAGAAEAMLGYLPFADDDDGMIAEVMAALIALAFDSNGNSVNRSGLLEISSHFQGA